MKNKIIILVVISCFIKIFLALTTYHSDVQVYFFAGEVLKSGNILGFYDYLWGLPSDAAILSIYPRYLFNYPPLVYFVLGGISTITTALINSEVKQLFLFNTPAALGFIQTNLMLLALKLPYFIFDLGVGYLLYKFIDDKKQAFLALILWLFNPVNFYATYMLGQYEIIPVFLVMMALYIAKSNNRLYFAAFLLGLGAAFKIYPILFIFPLAFIKESMRDKIKLLLVGISGYIVTILPFIQSPGFRKTALLAGQTTKSLYAAIEVSGGQSIYLYLSIIIFTLIVFFYTKNTTKGLWKSFFVLLLIFFIFTHYHPQWLLWLTPFLIIDLSFHPKRYVLVLLILAAYIGSILFFDPGLSLRLFAPIAPQLSDLPPIWELLSVGVNYNVARSLLHSAFVGVLGYYMYLYFPRKVPINKS